MWIAALRVGRLLGRIVHPCCKTLTRPGLWKLMPWSHRCRNWDASLGLQRQPLIRFWRCCDCGRVAPVCIADNFVSWIIMKGRRRLQRPFTLSDRTDLNLEINFDGQAFGFGKLYDLGCNGKVLQPNACPIKNGNVLI